MSMLSSQADPPTLKNLDFASAGARFLKNQGLGIKDALDGVLGLSWASFGGLRLGPPASGNLWNIIRGHGHCGGVGAQRIEI